MTSENKQIQAPAAIAVPDEDVQDLVIKALRKAWQLGQTYWQQADSEYISQQSKSDVTQAKFQDLVDETRAALAQLPVQSADAPIAYLQKSDQYLLYRFIETAEDDESFDIGKDAVKRLANLGVVESCGFGRYGVTMFGYWVHEHYWHQNPSLPLKTNADRDRERRAAMAAAQEGGKA